MVEYLAYRMGNPLKEPYINSIKVVVSKIPIKTPLIGYEFVKGTKTNNINYKQTKKIYTYIQVRKTKEFKENDWYTALDIHYGRETTIPKGWNSIYELNQYGTDEVKLWVKVPSLD